MVLVAILAVIGLLVLLAWPLLVQPRGRRAKRLDQPTVDHVPVPSSTQPDGRLMPGSEPYRDRQGKP